TGISATPSVIIQGTELNAMVGAGVTAVRWSSATRDDLAIGAPFSQSNRGRIFVFRGGAGFPTSGTVGTAAASPVISVNRTSPGWFAASGLGWTLTATDFDGDGTQDLAAGAIFGGGNKGGVVILFGGTVTASAIALSDVDASGLAGVEAEVIENPSGTTG